MKKRTLGAALLLFIGFSYASATGLARQTSQPHILHNIVSTQLPAALLTSMKTGYKDYWITECREEGKKNREKYFITLENADQTVQLKSNGKSAWQVVTTQVKE